jgi:hypothetical protein
LADHQPEEQEKFDDIPVRTPKDQDQDIPDKDDECAGRNIVLALSAQNASSRLPIVTNTNIGYENCSTKSNELYPSREVGTTQGTKVEPLIQHQSTFVELVNSDKLDLMRNIQKRMKTYPRPQPAEPLTEPEALYKNLAEEEDGNTEITGTMALLGGFLSLTR